MWVVKLGGSLLGHAELSSWLSVLGEFGGGRIVVVPGGGPFADQVRKAQARVGFDDMTAHRMALKATEQYGLLITSRESRLQPAASVAEIHSALARDQVPVWFCYQMVSQDSTVPVSWDVTSDSLAAWLAMRLGASKLVLIKSFVINTDTLSLNDCCQSGAVDHAFPHFLSSQVEVWLCGRGHCERFREALQGDGGPGVRAVVSAKSPTHINRTLRSQI